VGEKEKKVLSKCIKEMPPPKRELALKTVGGCDWQSRRIQEWRGKMLRMGGGLGKLEYSKSEFRSFRRPYSRRRYLKK